ncbi:MAG TPA: bile acid:sodium symporter family protein, partial [Longimicrobiaceae bacterium]|nr:bile acid:sodium symporter family protein [Longimicrobiaceae bacterium]
ASNVITYLARANLPLSVLLTMCSTLIAVVATPYLTGFLAGSYVDVDEVGLLLTTLQVVLLPVTAGLLLNRFAPGLVRWLRPVFPLVSVVVIALIVGAIVGVQRETIAASAKSLLVAVFVLHAGGFALGWGVGRVSGFDVAACRTLSVEVGMQNSGLGAALARKHFAAEPMTAVPAAISAVYHCVIGSLLAAWWRRRPVVEKTETKAPVTDAEHDAVPPT